jgi:hypothetical protein
MKVTIQGYKNALDEDPVAVEIYEGDYESVNDAVLRFAEQFAAIELNIDEHDDADEKPARHLKSV